MIHSVAVSALVVNYQVYEDLQGCLCALEAFLSDDDEVLVVDNASDPRQLAVIAAAHPRVRFLPQHDNIGFSAGVNLAAGIAKNPFLLLLNPDALMRDPSLVCSSSGSRTIRARESSVPRVLNSTDRSRPSARPIPRSFHALGGRSSWLSGRFRTTGCRAGICWAGRPPNRWMRTGLAGACLMTTRSAFMQAGGLDEGILPVFRGRGLLQAAGGSDLKCTYLPHVTVRHAGGHSAQLVPALAIARSIGLPCG
jgi:N-acetylglucosaminyl-diphospho-decaprenol L-rhamnosyltransferase